MNIYDKKEFDKNKYQWNQEALKKAKKFQLAENIVKILCIAIMLLMFFVSMCAKLFYIRAYFISLLGIVIMSIGLQYALRIKRSKTIKKLKKEVQHDMILYEYHRNRRQARIVINRQLVNMAWMNIQLRRYDLAQMALGRLEIESCNAIELQQIYFLQMIVATEKREKQKAQEWYIRYNGVNLEAKDQEKKELEQAILNENVEQLKELFQKTLLRQKNYPLFIAFLVILVAYSIIFTSIAYGVNEGAGYALRRNFILISLPVIVLGPGVFITWFAVLIHRVSNRLHKKEQKSSRYLHTMMQVIVVVILWVLIGLNALMIFSKIKGKETVIKKDKQYTYINVISYTNGGRYRTNNPFIMQNTIYAFVQSQKKTTKQIPKQNKEITQERLQQTRQIEELSPEDAMKAVYQYIKKQNMFSTMKLEYENNAKGETYAKIHTGKELRDGKTLKIIYTLSSNGTKEAKDGTICQEIVLQRQYTDNNYETRIVDFYLVNPSTKKVTDEHKRTW